MFLFQGLLVIILTLPFLLIACNSRDWSATEGWGFLVWAIGVGGEAFADQQKQDFISKPENKGKVCDVGLWAFTRHPNYFFEWVVWIGLSLFASFLDNEAKYKKIIVLGKSLPHLDPCYKIPSHLVRGCQSQMFLHSYLKNDLVIFEGESDALISAGLAALLIHVYSQETPEAILKCPPLFLKELGITEALSPSRANGLLSLYLRMKQEAAILLTKQNG
jgi:cysteine desulfuration protein SufE